MSTEQLNLSTFTRLRSPMAGDLQSLREAGMNRFEQVGLPTSHEEEWRFTNTDPLAEIAWQLPTGIVDTGLLEAKFAIDDAVELVLGNGALKAVKGTCPKGLYIGALGSAPPAVADRARALLASIAGVEKSAFTALNAGLLEEVIVVHVARGVTVEPLVHVLSLATTAGTPLLFSPRILVIAEEGAVLRWAETHADEATDALLSNTTVELFAEAGSVVEHYQSQWNSLSTFAISTCIAQLGAGSTYSHYHASLSGKLIRNELEVILNGERADATLNGIVFVSGQRHVDNHTLIRHEMPNCISHELYKHVVADEAFGVFKGKIFVQKDAQHTDSKQTSRTLLLSDRAMMESMPALEIYADDVKCTHGSTTGPLDEQMLFYSRSRGLSADAARHVLIYAFAADITARMKARPVRRQIERYLAAQQDLPQDLRIEAS